MTDKQKQILSLVLTAIISLVVGICGVFGIQVYSSCASTGSVDWDTSIERLADVPPEQVLHCVLQ